jgi:hypothetical protein
MDHDGLNVEQGFNAIERWLASTVASGSAVDSSDLLRPVASKTPAQRLQLLHSVLERRPSLERAARGLPLGEQLKLSLELAGHAGPSNPPPPWIGPVVVRLRTVQRCRARRRGRPR